NSIKLKDIDEFANSCDVDSCIRWYTKQTFVYKLINQALRTEDILQLYKFRYYIADLSQQLVKECQKTVVAMGTNFRLYRGTTISQEEKMMLQANVNRLIVTNAYWSTSSCREIALGFAHKFRNEVEVLYEIQCDLDESNPSNIVADISKLSEFQTENEFLFDAGSVFLVERVDIAVDANGQ
ncbi:unnamed protein product, partial [Adineta ricciae]